jgi:TolA-binding protein
MKTTIKNRRGLPGLATAGCAVGLMLPLSAPAVVSDADFNALKAMVEKLNDQVQSLQQTNAAEQQMHQQDMEQIQQLQEKLALTQLNVAQTQQTATQAQQTAQDAEQKTVAEQMQPMPRVPLDEATVNHNFMMLGDAEFQYVKSESQHGAFQQADFAPIFLYRAGDNILFEAGFDTTLANNAPNNPGYTTTFNMSFAQLDYVMNDYLTLCVGELLLPLGTYSERGAGWLNKFPDDPLAVDAIIPGSGVGAQLRGAVPFGNAGKFINYSVYAVNGPGSADGTGNASALDLGGNVGTRSDGVVANLHESPGGGARVGVFLPFKPHYDLELGVSGMSSEWDNAGNHQWSAGVLDAAVHLGPNFEARGEYIMSRYGSDDMGQVDPEGWYAQAGYKLAGLNLELPVVNNLELVGRYDSLHDGLGNITQRYTAGYVYYFTSTLLFEGDYEFVHSNVPTEANQLILQLSLGF